MFNHIFSSFIIAGTGLQPIPLMMEQVSNRNTCSRKEQPRLIFTSISLTLYIIFGAGKMPAPAESIINKIWQY
jgi:hypothetical protein